MNDTSHHIQQVYSKMLMNKTVEERMKMSSSMFEVSKTLIESSIKVDLSTIEKKIFILKRLYSNDFSEDEMNRIVEHFKKLK